MIAYAVCSHVLYPYLTVNADLTPTFKTHARLDVVFDMEALAEHACQRSKSREIPEALGPDIRTGLLTWLRLVRAAWRSPW
eukprot:9470701-Pyramimonas_sp.AAC.1